MKLSEVFGQYRAEWHRAHIYDFFTKPNYFSRLLSPRTCVLEGGRGSGKTTVLKCLSVEGQLAHAGNDFNSFLATAKFLGFYWKVDTNKVCNFSGPELEDKEWDKIFAHYINLVLCGSIAAFLNCAEKNHGVKIDFSRPKWGLFFHALRLKSVYSTGELENAIIDSQLDVENYVNNLDSSKRPFLSPRKTPLDLMTSAIVECPEFSSKIVYFIVDEYENLSDKQQVVFNTLIKHSADPYVFKIGIKELGWKEKRIVGLREKLQQPADYELISITEELDERFADFSEDICNSLLRKSGYFPENSPSIKTFYNGLNIYDEADLLDVSSLVGVLELDFKKTKAAEEMESFQYKNLRGLEKYCALMWSKDSPDGLIEIIQGLKNSTNHFNQRMSNFGHAMLYAIRKNRRGGGGKIQKYYCGWSTYVLLAHNNIRYMLQLIHLSLSEATDDDTSRLFSEISYEAQTNAAIRVGGMAFEDLQGIQASKFALAMGRIFQLLASQPIGHAPEINQFGFGKDCFSDTEFEVRLNTMLNSGVMHLAFVQFKSNKTASESVEIRRYDYRLHPVMSPFFGFSYRSKRKLDLNSKEEIDGLMQCEATSIAGVLRRHNRDLKSEVSELPDQLTIFGNLIGDI